mgnify:CR=1 FL=1
MKTEVIKIDQNNMDTEALERAAAIIRDGGLVAFPTETVYGLGADALSAEASKKIYAAKGRPSDNPLIVHVAEFSDMEKIAQEMPEEAKKLADAGKSATEIKEILEAMKFESTIYIMVDTLEYLKKGGRITPAAAAIGSLLKIKPVLQIRGEKLDSFAKARTVKQAKQIMMDAIAKDMDEVLHDPTGENTIIAMAHTQNEEEIAKFKAEVEERFPGHDIFVDPLSLVVSSHIGPGALAVTCTKKLTSF